MEVGYLWEWLIMLTITSSDIITLQLPLTWIVTSTSHFQILLKTNFIHCEKNELTNGSTIN